MEGGESPLDVLSRAATMVQENQDVLSNNTDDASKQSTTKQLPTTKWKRDRRCRLPEYSRKSDPKIPEVFAQEVYNSTESSNDQPTSNSQHDPWNSPIDMSMSIRQRGSPPSYSQTVNNPGYRSNYRTPVGQSSAPTRENLPPGISMCDPIIDEHFRRSLGNDYHTLFSNNNIAKEPSPVRPPSNPSSTTNVIEMMDPAGLSVDDHFAKALGDTWVKLNKKDMKNGSSEGHSLVTI